MLEGRGLTASDLRDSRIFDRVVDAQDEQLLPAAIALANAIAQPGTKHPLIRNLPTLDPDWRAVLDSYVAPNTAATAALRALRAAYESVDFEQGLVEAQRLYDQLLAEREQD